jgi:PBSX family phage terminase large subunit
LSAAHNLEENYFRAHSDKQEELILSDEDLTILACGTQWGKSIAGALWIKRQIHTFTNPDDNFIIASPTYKILNQSILPYFLNYMFGLGKYNSTEGTFKIDGCGTVYLRTETDPDSIVGIPNVKAGWIDEAGKIRLYFWENYQARAASKGARTLLTTSPYARNWMYKDYIKPITSGKGLPGVKLIQAASWENPFHTLFDPIKREAQKSKMDPRRFDMIFGGEWGQMSGLVYDCFDQDVNIVDQLALPAGTKYYGGIDWGFTEPFVLLVRAVTPSGEHYQVSETYRSGLTITDIIQIAKQKKSVFNIECFYCGKDQPGYIEEFNRNGLVAISADNDVRRGIDAHYELIRSRKFKIFKDTSPHTLDEIETYHYPEPDDLGPDDKAKDQLPVQANDHAMDAARYLSISLQYNEIKRSPVTHDEVKKREPIHDLNKFFTSLKKKKHHNDRVY